MSFVIRDAELNDLNGLSELMYEYIVGFYKKPRPDLEKLHQLIRTLLQKKEGIQFVAEQDGKLIGFATLYFTFSTMKADRYTVMNDLFVIEPLRDTEVEAHLFLECQKYTQEHQFTHMSWITAADNKRAQRFFDKMGSVQGDWINYTIV
ncbi:N-acetylglutamate synthase, GNAT family [Paenibacillus sp. UNCCL117]|uniref:GNAT family N-acetyltransferase n=1 Tax=unclassified Paenibacillus TaxID=185978 RepID=UPI00088E4D9C|nr:MULTISPECIES: GNAT family N-acetyltransferase [unclassified Paenibacillus]SDE22858.1 N-acetylglutamate synthase, GNAT family [Paenibacillus sp. cl123]SFW42805.1 N-acetylglutamate synthase, GNAT family [Paenibacillus sp. UNCCL117]